MAVLALLGVAKLLGALVRRIGLPSIAGELATGVVLGPTLLGHLFPAFSAHVLPGPAEQMHLIDGVGQLGVLLLVGITGTHVDVRSLRRRAKAMTLVSGCGLVVPLALGVAIGLLLPVTIMGAGVDRGAFAMFIGVALCITAIPVIAKTLSDMGLMHRNVGQLILGAGMIDDIVGWLLLSVVSAAATVGFTLGVFSTSVLYLAAFLLVVLTAGRLLVRAAMRRAARTEGTGATVATAVLLLLAGATTTHLMHLEAIFGAFVVGILITGVPEAQPKLGPLRTVTLSVLAPLFLATAGLRMDLTALADPGIAIAAVVLVTAAILGKFAGAYFGAKLAGLTRWEGLAVATGMNTRGVVEVVIALTGLRLGILNTATYTMVVLVAVVTSLMAPPLLRYAMNRVAATEDESLRQLEHQSWHGVPAAEQR